jgi:hypothetical protein
MLGSFGCSVGSLRSAIGISPVGKVSEHGKESECPWRHAGEPSISLCLSTPPGSLLRSFSR